MTPRLRVLLVAIALVLVGAGAALARPGSPAATARQAPRPVVARTLVCPSVPAPLDGTAVTTRVVVNGSGPAVPAGTILAGPPGALAPVTLTRAGSDEWSADLGSPGGRPVEVTASGDVAGLLTASRLTRGTVGATRGWAWDRCTAPVGEAWFAGVSTVSGTTSTLHLVDVDDVASTVDVRLVTTSGMVTPAAGSGLVVPAHGGSDVDLVALDAGDPAFAVDVVAGTGRVASAITETRDVTSPLGVEPVPQQQVPGSTLVLAGVPGLPTGTSADVPAGTARFRHTLVLADPGGSDAHVSVEVTDATGRFVPTSVASIDVAAGTVRTIAPAALDPALSGGPVTLRVKVSPPVPVLATMVVDATSSLSDEAERLRIGATPASTGPVVVPVVAAGTDLDTTLTLASYSSHPTNARVVVEPAGVTAQVAIPAGREAAVSLGTLGGPGARVALVTPVAGAPPLYAAAVVSESDSAGPLLGGIALSGNGNTVEPPATSPDITAALP